MKGVGLLVSSPTHKVTKEKKIIVLVDTGSFQVIGRVHKNSKIGKKMQIKVT